MSVKREMRISLFVIFFCKAKKQARRENSDTLLCCYYCRYGSGRSGLKSNRQVVTRLSDMDYISFPELIAFDAASLCGLFIALAAAWCERRAAAKTSLLMSPDL